MRILLSPTKKMRQDGDFLTPRSQPVFQEKAVQVRDYLRGLTPEALQTLWGCNASIAEQNVLRLREMDFKTRLTPAILAYEGLAFQYMAPSVFEDAQFDYVQQKLRILSGLYGVLKPMDGIQPYRLEMQAPAPVGGCWDLYEFWGDALYRETRDEDGIFLNLASKEYSGCIENYLTPADTFITCIFAEEVRGKMVQKGTFAKMARGEMVRFLAERSAESPETMKDFDRLNFHFRPDLSTDTKYLFQRIPE